MVSRCFCWFLHRLNCCRVCYSIEPWEKRWSKRLSSWMYVSDLLLCRSILTYRQRVTTFPPFPSRGPFAFPIPLSHVTFPFPVTLLFIITCRRGTSSSLSWTLTHYAYPLISDVLYDTRTCYGRPFPGLFLYLTLASTMTKP